MRKAWIPAVAIVASLGHGCGRRNYVCASRGDVSQLAQWKTRGFVTDGDRVQICEASPQRFLAVYAATPWLGAYEALRDQLAHRGWGDSWRQDLTLRMDDYGVEQLFERNKQTLRLSVRPLPNEWNDRPYTIQAQIVAR
jgi:hypothetical protein